MTVFNQQNPNGIAGHQIKLKVINAASDPTTAVNAARQLISDKVAAVIITSTDPAASAQEIEVLNAAKIPTMTATSANQFLDTAKFPYFFTMEPSSQSEATALSNWILGHNLSKVAILTDGSPNYESDISYLKTQLGSKASIVKQVTFPTNATDLSPEIQQLKGSNPDVVLVLTLSGFGAVWNAMHTASWSPQVLTTEDVYFDGYTSLGSLTPTVSNLCPAGIGAGEVLPTQVSAAVTTVRSKIGQVPDSLAPIQLFLSQFEVLNSAIQKNNSIDGTAIAKGIESIHNQSFFYSRFVFDFSPTDHAGYAGENVCHSGPLNAMGIPIISPPAG